MKLLTFGGPQEIAQEKGFLKGLEIGKRSLLSSEALFVDTKRLPEAEGINKRSLSWMWIDLDLDWWLL